MAATEGSWRRKRSGQDASTDSILDPVGQSAHRSSTFEDSSLHIVTRKDSAAAWRKQHYPANPDGSLSDTTPALQIAADVVGRSCAQWSDIPRVRVDSCRRPACHLATMPKYLVHWHKDPLVPYWDEVGSLSKVRGWWLVVSNQWMLGLLGLLVVSTSICMIDNLTEPG